MRTAELVGTERIERRSRDRPTPTGSDVLVAVSDVGICGSDLHWYTHGRMGDRIVEEPLILGHESAGEVIEVGDDVETVAVGDRVAIEPGVPCGHCEWCRNGQYNLCPDVEFMATPGTDGALREVLAWPAAFVHELPASVGTRAGALCEPISVAVQAIRRANIDVGDTVLVMGAGPIGTLAADVARIAGAGATAVADIVPSKLRRATDRGADLTIDTREQSVVDSVSEAFDGGVDLAIDATGVSTAIETVLKTVRPAGTVVLIGLAPDETIPMDAFEVVRGEIDVRGSYRFANTYPSALSLLERDRIDTAGMIDVEAPFEAVGEAFERTRDPEVIKGMISIE